MNPVKRILLLACFCLLPTVDGRAEPQPEATSDTHEHAVWVNPGVYAHHFQHDKDLRDNNYGLGFEVTLSQSTAFAAGVYRNSHDFESHYFGLAWKPLQIGPAKFGLVGLAVDGYPRAHNGQWIPAALAVMSLEGERLGVNFFLAPNYGDKVHGAFIMQLKLRIW